MDAIKMRYIAVLTRRKQFFVEFMEINFPEKIISTGPKGIIVREDPDENMNDITYRCVINPYDGVGFRFDDFIVLEDSESDTANLYEKLICLSTCFEPNTNGYNKLAYIFRNENV